MRRSLILTGAAGLAIAGLIATGPVNDQGMPHDTAPLFTPGLATVAPPYVCHDDGAPGWACYLANDPAAPTGVAVIYAGPRDGIQPATTAPPVNDPAPAPATRDMSHLAPPTYDDGSINEADIPWAEGCEQITPELWFNHTTMLEGDGTCPRP